MTAQLLDLPAEGTQLRRTDAVTLLTIYTFLLMVIPSPLVFSPLGGAGGPDTIFGCVLLVMYLVTLVTPFLAVAKGPQPIRVAAVLFTCVVIAAYISANRRSLPSLEQNGADRGLILMLGWLGIMLVAADGIPSMDRLKVLLRRIVLGATAMSILAIVQFATGLQAAKYIQIPGLTAQTPFTDLLTRNNLNRPSATAIDPIELACVLAICLPIAIHQARFAAPGEKLKRWLQAALIGAALPMTVSRTGIVALAAAALVLLPTWPKRDRRVAYVVGVIAVGVMYASIPGLLGEFRSLFGQVGTDTSSTSRTGAFSRAMPFVSMHPWLGRGFGTFLPATYFFTDDQYLLSLIEIGFIGLFALLGLFITGYMCARNARRLSTSPEIRDLGPDDGRRGGRAHRGLRHLRRDVLRHGGQPDLPDHGLCWRAVAAGAHRPGGRAGRPRTGGPRAWRWRPRRERARRRRTWRRRTRQARTGRSGGPGGASGPGLQRHRPYPRDPRGRRRAAGSR